MSSKKVKQFIKEMRAVRGAHYRWWRPVRGATHLPHGAPMYTRGKYSASHVKKNGVNCTGLGNQALGRMGVPIPEVRGNDWWAGGTPEWFDALKNRRRITERERERGFPVGTALISDYVDADHQGHIVWVTTPMRDGKQLTIGSDAAGPGPNRPGVTEQRTVRDAIATFGLTHAGETPGIGVMDAKDAEDEEPDEGRRDDGRNGERQGTFTVVDLREAMPSLPLQKARDYFPYLVAAMREGKINTRVRACHFLAQIGHESSDLLHMEEQGSTAYFRDHYEGRSDLGNTRPGDGARYHGRGPIQLTGRANYRAAGHDLGLDLERNPEKAADPKVAFRIAVRYWGSRNINKAADRGDAGIKDVTRLINGGYNGLADRERRYFVCKRVLPSRFVLGKGGEGGEMSFQRVILAHATHEDGVLAHEAAAVLHNHGIKCTVADASNMEAAIAACQEEKISWGDFVVIGEDAEDMFPRGLKKYIGESVRKSDYRDAVGRDLEETAEKLAAVLDGIASREDVDADLGRELEDALDLERLMDRDYRRDSDDENDDDGDDQPRRRRRKFKSRRRGDSNGNGHGREDDEAEMEFADLTDEDLEELREEALDLVETIRKLTGHRGR